ncbi:MAG: phosphatase [Coriobacteriaceae bacterium]|nr:phosphatase [Coriobacteriaceae bacterium]
MPYQILGDVHTHTLFSRHAYSTIQENVRAAADAGLEILGSTDHFSRMLFPDQCLKNFQFFSNIGIWPREWDGVTLLRGAEADIEGLDGRLFGQDVSVTHNITEQDLPREQTLYERLSANFDYVIASVHRNDFADGATIVDTTQMYINALLEPRVMILGHTGRAGVPYDLDAVLECAKSQNKLIEINEHSIEIDAHDRFRPVCRRIAERCAELGVGVTVDSDAHIAPAIGRFNTVEAMLEEIHFPEELIMNRGRAPFIAQLKAAGVKDLTSLL